MYTYPVELKHIYISPRHNYFGKPKDGPGDHPTTDRAEVEAVAGRGLAGDRYFGVAAHFDAQVTFIGWEVFAALQAELGRPELSPVLTRRNIVLAGAPLNQLIGQEFTLACGDDSVRFWGAKPCSPCAWMNAMLGPGAQAFLRGRGGLRARVLDSGRLRRGPASLITAVPLDLSGIVAPIAKPRLP